MDSPDAEFAWSDQYLLGYKPMDRTHEEFVVLVGELLKADDSLLAEKLEAFAAHAARHFDEEKQWMVSSEFPAHECHVDEHDKVLASLEAVKEGLYNGDVDLVRSFAKALRDWFPGHADYMDSALSAWMVKREYNGKPLVFKRKNSLVDVD